MTNIKAIIQRKTDVSFESATHKRGYTCRRFVIVAICVLSLIAVSAFATYRFNTLAGDELAFSSVYLGDGEFHVIVSNLSNHKLKLQDTVKVMQWSTGKEVPGKEGDILVEAAVIPAGETGVVKIILSGAYDVHQLQTAIDENDGYYFVLTNNSFSFGQDWMCSFDFQVEKEDEVMLSHLNFVENIELSADEGECVPEYESGIMVFEEWAQPTAKMSISAYFSVTEQGENHEYINVAGEDGENIYAVGEGFVTEIGFDAVWGNYVILSLDEHTTVKYGHLKEILVKDGDKVSREEVIGYMGRSGMATGINLAFEVQVDGVSINPLK